MSSVFSAVASGSSTPLGPMGAVPSRKLLAWITFCTRSWKAGALYPKEESFRYFAGLISLFCESHLRWTDPGLAPSSGACPQTSGTSRASLDATFLLAPILASFRWPPRSSWDYISKYSIAIAASIAYCSASNGVSLSRIRVLAPFQGEIVFVLDKARQYVYIIRP